VFSKEDWKGVKRAAARALAESIPGDLAEEVHWVNARLGAETSGYQVTGHDHRLCCWSSAVAASWRVRELL
jgi:hypothetical protein